MMMKRQMFDLVFFTCRDALLGAALSAAVFCAALRYGGANALPIFFELLFKN